MNNKKSILIINVSRIGDTLLATPSIKAISLAYPDARIDVLGHPKRVALLKWIPFIDNVGFITKNTSIYRGWSTWLLRKPYEIAFVYGPDVALVSYALRVSRKVVAFRQKRESLNASLHKVVERPCSFKEDHAVKLYLRLPESVNISTTDFRLSYVIKKEEKMWAQERLINSINDFRDVFPLIGIQTTSFPTKSYRDWPIEHFIKLTRNIIKIRPKCHFILFGGPAPVERNRVKRLSEFLQGRATNVCGTLTLRETAALMGEIDLYVGVDTGPTHIISTFNIPMVVLYHSFLPSEYVGPIGHPAAYLVDHEHPTVGSPCEIEMSAISVDTVCKRVIEGLEQISS